MRDAGIYELFDSDNHHVYVFGPNRFHDTGTVVVVPAGCRAVWHFFTVVILPDGVVGEVADSRLNRIA